MFDERAFIAEVEAAEPDRFAEILIHGTAEQERALRAHLGDDRYQRMRDMALLRSVSRAATAPKGNVVVIHGIMGGELSVFDRTGSGTQVWAKALRLMRGAIERLRLGEDGKTDADPDIDVRATGIMKRHYGELLLSLSRTWNVKAFWFDWRKDLGLAAVDLAAKVRGWFEDEAAFHIVAHSMGGLVARRFIREFPARWTPKGARISKGRLVMLGTPNHGSFAIPQAITGLDSLVRKIAALDMRHDLTSLLGILNSFVGSFQMLPSQARNSRMEPLYRSETYGDLDVPQRILDIARRHHELLASVVEPERMVYVAGSNRPTLSDIRNLSRIRSRDAYDVTLDGDGRVPHSLGLLARDGEMVPTYYVDEEHGRLTSNARVLSALDELLESGTTGQLDTRAPPHRAVTRGEVRQLFQEQAQADESRLDELSRRLQTRSQEIDSGAYATFDEREIEDLLTREVLTIQPSEPEVRDRRAQDELRERDSGFTRPILEIRLVHSGIEQIHRSRAGSLPVDVIAVGHYAGVRPQNAERALDRSLSAALPRTPPRGRRSDRNEDSQLLLTQYTDRGIIGGELGQPFFLVDPRGRSEGRKDSRTSRIIALVGMGQPGRFGVPELTVLARELAWSLGRLGRRHLATVLIGAGNGNLSVRDAIHGWLRGLEQGVAGSAEDLERGLRRVTFVEFDPRRVTEIDLALREEAEQARSELHLDIAYVPLDARLKKFLETEGVRWDRKDRSQRDQRRQEEAPTRVIVELDRGTYRLGAITATASVPEREIPLDPDLVMAANNELAAERVLSMQLERGQFLQQLLIPADLRANLHGSAPIVLIVDSATAQIHWEMVALPQIARIGAPEPAGRRPDRAALPLEDAFLGTSRGFTRQFRTTLAPLPEPPPPPRRVLRALVVADPAEDAPLAGAQEEGVIVARLLDRFNVVYEHLNTTRIEVTRMIGPAQATRTSVLRELMVRPYDVLHFAGHCIYDRDDPTASGWIFTGGQRLTAKELTRVDRIPKFVFSNACESGVIRDRPEGRSPELAPSFAQAFFERGVANFICTAWPVDDEAARQFAVTLYGCLLGLRGIEGAADRFEQALPEATYSAMQKARLAAAATINGAQTWGAYQHYGDPYFRLFDVASLFVTTGRGPAKRSHPRRAERRGKDAVYTRRRARRPGS